MNKKLGPLKLWQWIAVGAAVGIVVYLYEKNKSSSSSSTTPTTSDAIDPNTGIPYSQELSDSQAALQAATSGSGSAGTTTADGSTTTSSGTDALSTLEDELASYGQLQSEFSQLGFTLDPIDPQTGLTYTSELAQANGLSNVYSSANQALTGANAELQQATISSGQQSAYSAALTAAAQATQKAQAAASAAANKATEQAKQQSQAAAAAASYAQAASVASKQVAAPSHNAATGTVKQPATKPKTAVEKQSGVTHIGKGLKV